MTATAESPSASLPPPGRLPAPGTSPDRDTTPPVITRPRPGRELARTAASAAIIAAIFGFALPRFTSYSSALSSISAMTWPQALLIAAAASMPVLALLLRMTANRRGEGQ